MKITVSPRYVDAIDLLDEAMSAFRTVHLSLHARDLLDDDALQDIASNQLDAITKLNAVRAVVNKQEAA